MMKMQSLWNISIVIYCIIPIIDCGLFMNKTNEFNVLKCNNNVDCPSNGQCYNRKCICQFGWNMNKDNTCYQIDSCHEDDYCQQYQPNTICIHSKCVCHSNAYLDMDSQTCIYKAKDEEEEEEEENKINKLKTWIIVLSVAIPCCSIVSSLITFYYVSRRYRRRLQQQQQRQQQQQQNIQLPKIIPEIITSIYDSSFSSSNNTTTQSNGIMQQLYPIEIKDSNPRITDL